MTEACASPRFAADRALVRLARWLRLMGADVLCPASLGAAEVLRQARAEGRAMLTRDKRLRHAADVLYLEQHLVRDQIGAVMRRFPFDPHQSACSRCGRCNHPLRKVARADLGGRVPPFVYASQETFAVCDGCGHVYWKATQVERARAELAALGL